MTMTLSATPLDLPSGTLLTERAMLIDLTIRQFSGVVNDRKVAEEVARAHGVASADVGRYVKDMFYDTDKPLEKIQKLARQARADHRAMTLPWLDGDRRIISIDMLLSKYAPVMLAHKDNFYVAADEFVAAYPTLKNRAAVASGSLFNLNDWPATNEVEAMFGFKYDPMPIPPTTDWRVKAGADELARLQAQYADTMEDVIAGAIRDPYQRIAKEVGHMAERLHGYKPGQRDGNFHASLVDNVRTLAALLPGLNVTDDPSLKAISERIVRDLTAYDADVLKESAAKRQEIAAKADAIVAAVSEWV